MPIRKTINERANTLTLEERANLKAAEYEKIGTVTKERTQFSDADYQIEIVNIERIDGGVAVFAKAWTPDGKQIGFGKDGSVEIERFRIYNPPILVEDPNGPIERRYVIDEGEDSEEVIVKHFREDPKAALMQTLAHTIKIKKEKFTNSKISPGKVGNTTTTVYPDADPESTSMDAELIHDDTGGISWDTAHDATTGTGSVDDSTTMTVGPREDGNGFSIRRLAILFDTSSIPDTDTISAATLSFYATSIQESDNDANAYLAVVTSSPASNTSIADTDYDQFGTTEQHDSGERADLTTISTSAYTDIDLNATGISNISKTGVTKFGLREGHDINDVPIDQPINQNSRVVMHAADATGTANDPKLVIEHAAGATRRVFNIS